MLGGQSEVVDIRNLKFERNALRLAITAFVIVVALVMIYDCVLWAYYGGLPTLDSSLTAQGTFALPIVAGVAALGAGYGFFRNMYKGVPLFGELPYEVRKTIEEADARPSAAPSTLSAALAGAMPNQVKEDVSAPGSGAMTATGAVVSGPPEGPA